MRLTRSGRALAAAGILLIAVGVALDYPEAVALGAGAGGWCLIAVGWVAIRPALRADRTVPIPRVTEGEPVGCVLVAHNAGRRRSPELQITEEAAGRVLQLRLPTVPPGSTSRFRYDLPELKRGVYRLPPLSIDRIDPARLARGRVATGSGTTLYVHPAFHRLSRLADVHQFSSDGQTTRPAGGGTAFYGLRDYVTGDDRRLIHWPTSARAGHLVVREISLPDATRYLVALDTRRAAYTTDSFEEAVRIAASLSVAVVRLGGRLELMTTGGGLSLPVSTPRRNAPIAPALDLLAGAGLTDTTMPIRPGPTGDAFGAALIVGDLPDETLTGLAGPLLAAGPAVVVRVGSAAPGAAALPGLRTLTVRTSAEFAERFRGFS
ncbi:DUF58 domain-containing protein [Actinoplanes subtropicus]|uniref:DUF58 domain-containing protein n=1 Tax=Actinoplanes subtropicus TaxID=543632 RepID=UPI00068F1548|nr:DUF58 domain-containing protein [Actinoplanes subtropicus]